VASTACCPKIPAAKKRLKSRGATGISATSPPSSISQLGNVGNSRASKLLAIFTAIKFQSNNVRNLDLSNICDTVFLIFVSAKSQRRLTLILNPERSNA
jgi:hypothetical protein